MEGEKIVGVEGGKKRIEMIWKSTKKMRRLQENEKGGEFSNSIIQHNMIGTLTLISGGQRLVQTEWIRKDGKTPTT